MKLINKTKAMALAGLIVLTAGNVSEVAYAVGSHEASLMSSQSDYEPTLEAYQNGNAVKAEWAVDLLPDDILYSTSFEVGDDLPSLNYGGIDKGGGLTGGQSFSEESAFSGNRSLKIHDTYSNGQIAGNPINGVTPFSNMSRTRFLEKKYIDNGIDLSMSFKARTVGNSGTITPLAGGVKADYGIEMTETFAEDVNIGDSTVKVSDISVFKSTLDSGRLYYLADSKGQYNTITVRSYNEANSTITVNGAFNYNFKKGESIIRHRAVNPLTFPGRTLNSSEWVTVNMNTKVPAYPYFDIKKNGFNLHLHNSTRGTMYIDDLQLGHATQTELYRDGTKIYEGKLSDYNDTAAKDKVAPDRVENYNVNVSDNKQSVVISEPKDYGNSYDYQVKAVSNDGSGEYWSDTETVEVITGIKGYSYVIDTNPATNPSGTINNTTGEIEIDKSIYKDHYLHIQAIDGAGNKSPINHIKLDKVNDITKPSLNLTHTPTSWTNDLVTIYADATDNQSGIKEIFVVGEEMIRDGNFKNGAEEWEFVFPPASSSIVIEDGEATFYARGIDDLRNVSLVQNGVLRDGLRNDFRINVSVKGKGNLNTRFRVQNTGLPPANNPVFINTDTFEEHVFYVPYDKEYADGIVIELLGDGDLVINNIEMYETSEVENGKIEVHENGVYEFSVSDNAGNVETKSIEITNIDKKAPTLNITPNIISKTHKDIELTITAADSDSGIDTITYVNGNDRQDITKEKKITAAKNGTYSFEVKDKAGNITNKSYVVDNIVRELKFTGPIVNESVSATIAKDMFTELPVGNIMITDWRDSNNDWKLYVQADKLKNGNHTLSEGTLGLKGIGSVNMIDGEDNGTMEVVNDEVIIDDGQVELISSTDERGVYNVNFKSNALKINPDPSLVKKGTYRTTLIWTLQATAEIK